jgi:hypothetical protein
MPMAKQRHVCVFHCHTPEWPWVFTCSVRIKININTFPNLKNINAWFKRVWICKLTDLTYSLCTMKGLIVGLNVSVELEQLWNSYFCKNTKGTDCNTVCDRHTSIPPPTWRQILGHYHCDQNGREIRLKLPLLHMEFRNVCNYVSTVLKPLHNITLN